MTDILREANGAYELATMRIDAIVEAANRQREINFHEAELKVMTESGTDDELTELLEAAESDFAENIRKAITRLREAIVKFFSDCRQKLIDMMKKIRESDALKKIKQRLKLIPLLGKKKVAVEDYKEEQKIYEDHVKKAETLEAKVSSGQEVSAEEVDDLTKSFDDKMDDAVGVSNAQDLTLDQAVDTFTNMVDNSSSELKDHEATATKACDSATKEVSEKNASILNKIANAVCHFSKTIQNAFHRVLNGILSTIKKAIGAFKKNKDGKDTDSSKPADSTSTTTNESADDDLEMEKLAKQQNDANSKDSMDEDSDFDDDDIDLAFGNASDAMSAGFGDIDGMDVGYDDDDDEEDECGYECRESSDDRCLAMLAGVTTESTSYNHDTSYSDLMHDIMNL